MREVLKWRRNNFQVFFFSKDSIFTEQNEEWRLLGVEILEQIF